MRKESFINEVSRKKRLNFTKEYILKDENFYKNIIFLYMKVNLMFLKAMKEN